jgi:hypothetical protein
MPATVLISEVGPRDGLQSVARTLPLAHKLAWVTALHAAGLREIEVGSFVPAARLPQLADTAAVVAHARTLPRLTVMALVPNLQGAQAALAAGVHTCVDLHRLVAARAVLQRGLPGEPLHGMLPEAGLPPGFVYADGRLPDAAPLRALAAGAPA